MKQCGKVSVSTIRKLLMSLIYSCYVDEDFFFSVYYCVCSVSVDFGRQLKVLQAGYHVRGNKTV
jgi:hypothetical protein